MAPKKSAPVKPAPAPKRAPVKPAAMPDPNDTSAPEYEGAPGGRYEREDGKIVNAEGEEIE